MGAAGICSMLLLVATTALAEERGSACFTANDLPTLQQNLLQLAQQQLSRDGLSIAQRSARLLMPATLPAAQSFEARPGWRSDELAPSLPLTFQLRAAHCNGVPGGVQYDDAESKGRNSAPVNATLAVTLLRDTWVAARRLRKGSGVSCADFRLEPRPLREGLLQPQGKSCQMAAQIVALREIAAGDVLRTVDIGAAPDVSAGLPVRVSATSGGISISTTAIALADARVGDRLEVRLLRPRRILSTRVTARGAVQPWDGTP